MADLARSAGAPASRLLGLGSHRASRVVPNDEIVGRIDSSDEWVQQRSGIKERRWVSEDETLRSMAVSASRAALDRAGLTGADIDCVIVATVTHMMQTPALATLVALDLGTDQAAAFDISAACAGFCHGVSMASDMVRAGSARHVLVIGAEVLSEFTDPDDRGTAFIFSDGAGAVIVGASDTAGIGPVVWGSDGAQYDLIRQRDDWRDVVASDTSRMPHLVMQGNSVFRWASYTMAKVGLEAVERAGLTVDDLDCFVPHQANNRITDAMARAMKLPATVRIARDIIDQGNSSAASIPLALDRMVAEGEARSGDVALLIAFGAGLAYAAQVVVVP